MHEGSVATSDLGVYIHFPWCRKLCPYCDFPVVVARADPPHARYRDAILAELDERAPALAGRTLRSVYLGGGTPSLWDPDCIAAVVAAAAARFAADPAALEITVEANPIDCTPERMAAWRAAGVDRLSIGVQSFDDAELAALGRDHRMGDGPSAIAAALAAGFTSLSADLILGAPGSALDLRSVAAAAATGVDHLSVYELTIEDRTVFGKLARAGRLPLAGDDAIAAAYQAAHHALAERGFEHYEVSSYARPGRRAVHNSLYWRGAEYLGLGVGAASFERAGSRHPGGAIRRTNTRDLDRYLAGGDGRIAELVDEDAAAVAADLRWLAMRTSDGLPAGELPAAVAAWLVSAGLATRDADRIRPTLRGFLFADQVAARIVQAG